MASQRVGRYIAVQQAKGLNPDPQQVARLIQQDMQFGGGQTERGPLTPGAPPRSEINQGRAVAIQESISGGDTGSFEPITYSGGTTSSFAPEIGTTPTSPDIGEVDLSDPTLSEALSGELGKGTVAKGAAKGFSSAAYAALTTPSQVMNPATAAVKGFTASVMAPVSLALSLNSLIGSSVSAGMIGNSIEGAFGAQAAQEASDVVSGRVSLSSISIQGQNAYANAKVAAEQAPKSVLSHVWSAIKGTPPTPITSTVTPHHTRKAITEAFQVDPNALGPAAPFGGLVSEGQVAPGLTSPESIESGLEPIGGFGAGDGGGSASGGGDSGIGPGNY